MSLKGMGQGSAFQTGAHREQPTKPEAIVS